MFYGSIEEEAINSSVSGSQGRCHIGTGMKGKSHSGSQNSKNGSFSRNNEHCHIATTQSRRQRKKGVIENEAGKKKE